MLRSIIWYVKFVVTLIGKTPALINSKRILKKYGQLACDKYMYEVTTKWAMARIKDSGAQITVYDQHRVPKDEPVLFVSNHQSDFDIAIFMAMIEKNTGFVAKIEMEKVPLLRSWMRGIHCVFMDRDNLKQSLQTIIEGINNLKAGYSMVVFPEGTRSKSRKMGLFKAGSFKLATKSKVPIVPVTIDGSYKIMEGNNYKITPAIVKVFVHEPIYVKGMPKEEEADLPEQVREIIKSGFKID